MGGCCRCYRLGTGRCHLRAASGLCAMECKTCDALLADYKRRVGLFTNAERGFRGLLGDEFPMALKELKRLKQACKDADDALIEHCRQDHGNLSHKAASS